MPKGERMRIERTGVAVVVLALGLALGCGSGESGAEPVSSAPLRGNVSGTDFIAVSARARKSGRDPAKRAVEVYESPVGCVGSPIDTTRTLLVVVPWQSGFTQDFSLGGGGIVGSFLLQNGSTTTAVITDKGRIELIEAPTEKGAKGTMRLRMSADEGSVEGEIAVEVCE